MQLNGSQIFVEVLCEQGVDTLFGYPRRRSAEPLRRAVQKRRPHHPCADRPRAGRIPRGGRLRPCNGPHRRGAGHQRPGRNEPRHRHRHRLYGLCADGGLHRQRGHGGPGQGRLPGSLHRGHHDAHHQAQLHGAPGRRPGRHHACGFPHRPERPQRPGAGGHPEGCHRCGV